MNFCVATLKLKMEEKKQHFQHIMLYYFKKGENATETQKKICAVYGEGAVTDQMCQKWFVKFPAGDFSLDNAPRSGRPVEVDSNQIRTLTENSQHHTTREIADIFKISKSSVIQIKRWKSFAPAWLCSSLWLGPTQVKWKKSSWLYFCMRFST